MMLFWISVVASQFVQQLQLASQKRRVVYVQSYTTSKVISKVLNCAFYKAKADDKEYKADKSRKVRKADEAQDKANAAAARACTPPL